MKVTILLLSLLSLFLGISAQGDVSEEAQNLALKWAPFIWLHPEEKFFPVSPEFVIENVELRDENEDVVQEHPTPSTIFRGRGTETLHLNTFEDLECVNCVRPYFYGQPLEDVNLYAIVKEWNDTCNTIDVRFATYYAYNHGKDVCIGLDPSGVCLGVVQTFGNHVGDGDSTSIRFQNGEPVEIYLSVHSFGAFYAWNPSTSTFEFYKGEELRTKNKDNQEERRPVEYPQTVSLVEETHPEIFSANGSHGFWATAGKHNYLTLVIHLDDYCERGTAWRSWENLIFLDADVPTEDYDDDMAWADFRGTWGNIQELGCLLDPLVGECGLNAAGGGPIRPPSDFEAPPPCNL